VAEQRGQKVFAQKWSFEKIPHPTPHGWLRLRNPLVVAGHIRVLIILSPSSPATAWPESWAGFGEDAFDDTPCCGGFI
jgi:hypothetical protein